MLHPVGWASCSCGRSRGFGLPWAFLPGWPPACGGLDTGHTARTTGLGLSFQDFDPALQLGNDGLLLLDYRLLLGNDPKQNFSRSGFQVPISIHAT